MFMFHQMSTPCIAFPGAAQHGGEGGEGEGGHRAGQGLPGPLSLSLSFICYVLLFYIILCYTISSSRPRAPRSSLPLSLLL